ncbi:MAG: hypothetical protein PHP93_00770 [Kiritimatiellales bacterium]|nr:hypothetical protein [Kiritimatiellales bacterium]
MFGTLCSAFSIVWKDSHSTWRDEVFCEACLGKDAKKLTDIGKLFTTRLSSC